jgi:hypothetical protein
MNIRAELKSLKDNYEQSLQLYERTKKTQHYVIYQSGFRDYLSFIEQHRLRTSDVDHLVYSELPKKSKTKQKKEEIQVPKRAYRKSGTYQKVKGISPEQRALEWQQKIIDILIKQDRSLTLKELSSLCGLGKSQVWRYLDRLKQSEKVTDFSAFSKNGKQKVWKIKDF